MVKIIDSLTNNRLRTAKNEKQAKTIIYSLERNDRQTGDFTPNRYFIVVTGYRTDRRNKQARQEFFTKEI